MAGYRSPAGKRAAAFAAAQPVTLKQLTLEGAAQVGVASTIGILGATIGSAITLQSGALPAGMTLDSAARKISGTPTAAGAYTFTLRETLGGAVGSPKDSALTHTVTVVVPNPVGVDFVAAGAAAWAASAGVAPSVDSFFLAGDLDDTNAFQRAFDWAAINRKTVIGLPGKNYVISAMLTVDMRYSAFDGQGCTITASHSGRAIHFAHTYGSDATFFRSIANKFFGFRLIGPGSSAAGSVGIGFGDFAGITTGAAALAIEYFYIDGFETAIDWGSNTWCTEITKGVIKNCKYWGVFSSGRSNAGERISFSHVTFAGGTFGFDIFGAGFYFSHCSFDYPVERMFRGRGGAFITTESCHFENSWEQNGANWWVMEGGSCLDISNSTIVVAAARTQPLGTATFGDGSSINLLGKCWITNLAGWMSYTPEYLIDGHGRAGLNGYYGPDNRMPVSHRFLNLLGDGGFEKARLTDCVDISNDATSISISTTAGDFETGTRGLKIAPPNGKTGIAAYTFACEPGAQINFQGRVKHAGTASTDVFFISCVYYDKAGLAIGGTFDQVVATTTLGAWTTFRYSPYWTSEAAAWVRITIGKGAAALTASADGNGYLCFDSMKAVGVGMALSEMAVAPALLRARRAQNAAIPVNTGQTILLTSTSAAFTLKLPISPAQGDRVTFKDEGGALATNNVTIDRNGQTIRGASSNFVMNTNWQQLIFEFSGSTWVYA